MTIKDIILKNRSYRRFYQEITISMEDLVDWIDNARLSPSARNAQSLKYIISNEPEMNNRIFPHLAWAAYLRDWDGPDEGERPSVYLIMVNDKEISSNYFCDHGIAAQSILLGAAEKGFGGCIIASIQRDELAATINIRDRYEIVQVIALGKPKEIVKIENMGPVGDFRYWRDDDQVHHVPKRSIDDIILKL
jgi:nitroreductase